MTDTAQALVWLRNDLRLADNPALQQARKSAAAVLVVYILEDDSAGDWRHGSASRWWLHHSLLALDTALQRAGNQLILQRGVGADVIPALVGEHRINQVFWNRRYEPWAIDHDSALKAQLVNDGVEVSTCNASLVSEPWELSTAAGKPYQVFTPFWKSQLARGAPAKPLSTPRRIPALNQPARSLTLSEFDLLPTQPDWSHGLQQTWQPGEAGAARALKHFTERVLGSYHEGRDRPDQQATSALSPHLRFGEISPRQVWHAVLDAASDSTRDDAMVYLREIGWRDFSYNLLYHYPQLPEQNLRGAFDNFAWQDNDAWLRAWQQGRTGYPMVDAGMRQLWHTGWMHNRVRMIAASFLIKHLMTHWSHGARWFWDTLVDADLASNSASWQWVAGCGADAAPYFRIFNPISQGQKFDPKGGYIRRWVPELDGLDNKFIHAPFTANDSDLARAGIQLGEHYPQPLVDHKTARERALKSYALMRSMT